MDNSDFYLFWHRTQDEACSARRSAGEANSEAIRARNFADDARSSANDAKNAANNAKKSEIGAAEALKLMRTILEESKAREDAYLEEIRSLKNQLTSMYRAISKEKEKTEQREKVRRLDESRKEREVNVEPVSEFIGTTTVYSFHNRHIG